MKQLSNSGRQTINAIAQRHGFSADAVASMLDSVVRGNATMAQFNHPEFSGSGQWMSGGMTMVSDMFNGQLKSRVDSLCTELSRLVRSQPDLHESESFQSPHQGSPAGVPFQPANGLARAADSLFAPPAPGISADWWPSDLRWPNSTGAQNGVRYAYFAQARRLVIELNGQVTVYDTLNHQIGGFSQQQSSGGSVTFSSQYGLVDVTRLPVVSAGGLESANGTGHPGNPGNPGAAGSGWAADVSPPASVQAPAGVPFDAPQRAGNPAAADDIFSMIEKLADLRSRAIISDNEFNTKKTELLARL